MSYTTSLGAAASSKGDDYFIACKGQLYGRGFKGPDVKGMYCCDVLDWNNRLYRNIKGAESLRYHNEKRVRRALELLLEQGGVEQYAHARQTPLAPGFAAALKRAAGEYRSKLPKSRWVKQEVGVIHPKCGPYSTWKDPSPPAAAERAVIDAVPRGGDHAIVTDMPDLSQLLVAAGGRVGPSGWLQSFIKTFQPPFSIPSPSPPQKTIRQPMRDVAVDSGKDGGASAAGLAVGVVALVGAGALLWRWR